uniref:Secreted protein n=1 Tax=Anguilla anguilla TaxID=7936 RepID=A0A0E9PEY3_ANGAN
MLAACSLLRCLVILQVTSSLTASHAICDCWLSNGIIEILLAFSGITQPNPQLATSWVVIILQIV